MIKNNEEIHNHNCWLLLKDLKKGLGFDIHQLPTWIKEIINVPQHSVKEYPYRHDYTVLLSYLRKNAFSLRTEKEERIYQKLIQLIYLAKYPALDYTYLQFEDVVQYQSPTSKKFVSDEIAKRVSYEYGLAKFIHAFPQTIQNCSLIEMAIKILAVIIQALRNMIHAFKPNGTTPEYESSIFARFNSFIGKNYFPMERTNVPTRIRAPWLPKLVQIHLCTQVIKENGEIKINPLFKQFLKAQQHEENPKEKTFLYFNLLNRDATSNPLSRRNVERKMTQKLEQLEKEYPNLVVVTLPAATDLLNLHDTFDIYRMRDKLIIPSELKRQLLDIIFERGSGITDFHVSESLRTSQYWDNQEVIQLLDRSFTRLGITDLSKPISPAIRQAIWFHFTKYELPNYLISKINPEVCSFSCKLGIDRGGAASSYFNLVKSFEMETTTQKIMTQNEFNKSIHAYSTMVRARGMNSRNLYLLWVAVDAYVQANYSELNLQPEKRWLIEWRDLNCPKSRIQDLLERNLVLLQQKEGTNPACYDMVIDMTKQIKSLIHSTGARQLLELVIHTRNLSYGLALKRDQKARLIAFEKRFEEKKLNTAFANCLVKVRQWFSIVLNKKHFDLNIFSQNLKIIEDSHHSNFTVPKLSFD